MNFLTSIPKELKSYFKKHKHYCILTLRNYICCLGIFSLFAYTLSAQCPEQLFLASQEQILEFASAYPNCTSIQGDVIIEGYGTARIQDLQPLSQLTSIEGNLFIGNNRTLAQLNGLENIQRIGGRLLISFNPQLSEITALNQLSTIGSHLNIVNNKNLVQIDFPSLVQIEGDLTIFFNPLINQIGGFSLLATLGGTLEVLRNEALKDLSGLSVLDTIRKGLTIFNNASLKSLIGLNKTKVLGDKITIVDNPNLSACQSGFCDLLSRAANQAISFVKDNACGCRSIEEIAMACHGTPINCTPPFQVSGSLKTAANIALSNVSIILTGTITDTVTTDEYGAFSFKDLPSGDYVIRPEKDSNYINGITQLDASLIGRHAANMLPLLDSPYKILAADVDLSGSITTADVSLVRQLALGSISEWDKVPSWGFVDASIYLWNDNKDPWQKIKKSGANLNNISIFSLQNDITQLDFIGFKYGDVNESASY